MAGPELRALRISNRLVQRDLAQLLLGVGERTVQRWEASDTVPSIAEFALIGVSTIMDHQHEDAA